MLTIYQDENSPELRIEFDQYIKMHPEAQSIYLGTEKGVICARARA